MDSSGNIYKEMTEQMAEEMEAVLERAKFDDEHINLTPKEYKAKMEDNLLTPLTEEEYEEMLNTVKADRPLMLAWMRYKAEADFTELSSFDLFTDGFEAAQKIFDKKHTTECDDD